MSRAARLPSVFPTADSPAEVHTPPSELKPAASSIGVVGKHKSVQTARPKTYPTLPGQPSELRPASVWTMTVRTGIEWLRPREARRQLRQRRPRRRRRPAGCCLPSSKQVKRRCCATPPPHRRRCARWVVLPRCSRGVVAQPPRLAAFPSTRNTGYRPRVQSTRWSKRQSRRLYLICDVAAALRVRHPRAATRPTHNIHSTRLGLSGGTGELGRR